MSIRKNALLQIDKPSLFIFVILVLFGWINIYASVYNDEHNQIFDLSQRYGKQMLWIIISFVFVGIIFSIQSNVYAQLSYVIYGFSILSLLLVLALAKEVNGARAWLEIGSFKIQPSEFTKFAAALAFARFLSREKFKITSFREKIIASAIALIPVALIILQKDTGSALVYLIFIIPFYREGLSAIFPGLGILFIILFIGSFFWDLSLMFYTIFGLGMAVYALTAKKYKETLVIIAIVGIFYLLIILFDKYIFDLKITEPVIAAAGISIALLQNVLRHIRKKSQLFQILSAVIIGAIMFTFSVNYIFNSILEKHQRTRINVFLGIEEDVKGVGYNVNQSKIAIGSGGMFGKGFLEGTQTKLDFVPEQDTDFIFCTVGEEWGFAGTSIVIVLFLVLIVRLIFLAERQRSVFSRIYGYTTASILFLHFAVNIGMTIGLAPVIGIPLPFFSYGGSSLWAFTILLFVFLRLDVSRSETF